MGDLLRDTRLFPVWVLLVGALVLLPGLGSFGLWEPHEVTAANRANEIANAERLSEQAAINDTEVPDKARERAKQHHQVEPELTERMVALGLRLFGGGEGAGRFPLALLALIALLAAYFLGSRVAGPRAGLISALVLVSFPLLILNGRHLTSDIGSIAGTALVALGLIGLITRRSFGIASEHHPVHYAIDAVLIGAGGYLAYEAAGAFLGLLPPFVGCAVAAAVGLVRGRGAPDSPGERRARRHLYIGGGLAAAVALAAFVVFFTRVFDVKDARDADDSMIAEITGHSVEPTREYTDALGGAWRERPDGRIGFSTVLEQIAYGTFPWIAIIPIAFAAALIRRREDEEDEEEQEQGRGDDQRRLGTLALALWALAAYLFTSVYLRKVSGATFPAVVGLAVLAGVWLDRAMPRNPTASGERGDPRGGMPLVALFAITCAVVVGRDLIEFAEKLTSLNVPRSSLKFPEDVSAHVAWIGVCWAAALAVGVALLYRGARDGDRGDKWWRWLPAAAAHRAQRGGVIAGLALGVASALALTQVVTPALSSRLSTKNILETYRSLARDGEVLGIMGGAAGAAYYAGEDHEQIRGRNQLVDFLLREQRVFALTPKAELCPLEKISREKKFHYYVVDSESAQYRLLSNKLREGESDENPLAGIFVSEPPGNIRKKVSFNLDNQLELIGFSMPDSARRGGTFTMRLYFKVLKRVTRNWKMVLVHFDKGVRFQADHEPIKGTCGTTYWVPGDIVIDEFEVSAGTRAHPYGDYQVFTGLFVGSAGNYTNMKVLEGGDKHDRIPLGTLKLR